MSKDGAVHRSQLHDLLLELRRKTEYSKASDYIVINGMGQILDPYQVRRIHRRLCLQAEIKRIRPHDMRHTYASHYVMNGGGIAELQMLLGQSSPQRHKSMRI